MQRESRQESDVVPGEDALREAAWERVRETTLRFTAREMGISASSLTKFLHTDAVRYGRTLDLLRGWYRRDLLRHQRQLSAESAATAVELLLGLVPAPGRRRAAAALVQDLERLHEHFGAAPPAWLDPLRRVYGAGRAEGNREQGTGNREEGTGNSLHVPGAYEEFRDSGGAAAE